MDSPSDFDAPMFKILAHNDTGKAHGHQAGIVIPKDLDPYFPALANRSTPEEPVTALSITAELYDGPRLVGLTETRYQYQTWGGTRSPERRITGNLGPIRNLASAGDLLVIERGLRNASHYRLTLYRTGTKGYRDLEPSFADRRWGVLLSQLPPVEEADVEAAVAEIEAHEQQAFQMFEPEAPLVEGRTRRVARSRAFQARVQSVHGTRCVICDNGLVHPLGRCEIEAAHIVPRRLKGSDDVRNGLMLCRSHHWAFDAGVVGVSPEYRVIIPGPVRLETQNAPLMALADQPIRLPQTAELRPSPEALQWHCNNILLS